MLDGVGWGEKNPYLPDMRVSGRIPTWEISETVQPYGGAYPADRLMIEGRSRPAGCGDYRPFFSNQRKSPMKSATRMTMTIQWLIPRTAGRVIFPKSPQVRTVSFMRGYDSA